MPLSEQQITETPGTDSKKSESAKIPNKVTIPQRIVAAGVFFAVFGLFGVLWAGANSTIDMTRLFGICEFKRTYGLPCVTCGMTTSAMAFVQGRICESFYIQPAAMVFCSCLVVIAVFALLITVFGVNFAFLQRLEGGRIIKYVIVLVIIILSAGWAVTIARALAGKSVT